MASRAKSWLFIVLAVAALLVVATLIAMRYGANVLKARVQDALGPQSEITQISVGLRSVEVKGVTVHAPSGWPAKDTLRADRIVIVPDLLSLITRQIRVKSISVEGSYVSLWRTQEGRMRLVPSLLERPQGSGAAPSKFGVEIGSIELKDGVVEFFDATVVPVNHRIRLEQLNATVGPVQTPGLTGRTSLHIAGKIKGPRSEGKAAIDGWLEIADKNSEISTNLSGVDLVTFQPYLLKAADTSIKSGVFDLQVKATVKKNQLHAPGGLTLTNLELAEGEGVVATFMGLPRTAVLSAMKNKQGVIAVPFILAGNVEDPQFSLNGSFTKQIAQSFGQTVGVSLEGLVKGATEPTTAMGSALKRLLKR